MNKPSKKLTLSREAVRQLTQDQLSHAAGGEITIGYGPCRPYPSQDACSIGPCPNSDNYKCY